jgi:uncharacterized protein DUF3999
MREDQGTRPRDDREQRLARHATRGICHVSLAVVLLALLRGILGAQQASPEDFRFERTVTPGARGPNRLSVDVPLLSGGTPFSVVRRGSPFSYEEPMVVAEGGLSDLRLYDAGNREVPYLLVTPAIPALHWHDGTVLPVAETKETSGFESDLGSPLVIDRIRINGLPAPFLKRVLRLEGSGDRTHWTLLVREGTLFDLPDEGLRQVELEFTAGEYRYLRVTWDDRTSGRVPLPSAISARPVAAGAPRAPVRAQVSFERRASEPGKSRFRLRLPGSHLPIVAIELSVGGGNLLREAKVSEARLVGEQVAPVLLGSATLRRAVRGDVSASALRIPIDPPSEAQLELTVDDGDNPPLSLTGVSVILATLPFIYFESDGAPLIARYGNERLAAPRYDLEAIRDSVPGFPMAEAAWGARRDRTPVAAAAASPLPLAGAPIEVDHFRYSRVIPGGARGLAAVRLDAAVLAHSRFADLRIADAQGRQVPYLCERLDEPLTLALGSLAEAKDRAAATPSSTGGVRTYYRLRLPFESLPPARLVLTTRARVFQRRVSVEVERRPTDGRRDPWTDRVADVVWSHTDPETPTPALTMALPTLGTAEAFVVIEEGDNSPLPLEPASLLLPAYRLRFFREAAGELTLLYGRDDLAPPRYDLALLAPRLVGAAAEEITPGDERLSAVAAATRVPTLIFWGVLVGAVLVLLVLIARLVKQADITAAPEAQ